MIGAIKTHPVRSLAVFLLGAGALAYAGTALATIRQIGHSSAFHAINNGFITTGNWIVKNPVQTAILGTCLLGTGMMYRTAWLYNRELVSLKAAAASFPVDED